MKDKWKENLFILKVRWDKEILLFYIIILLFYILLFNVMLSLYSVILIILCESYLSGIEFVISI